MLICLVQMTQVKLRLVGSASLEAMKKMNTRPE